MLGLACLFDVVRRRWSTEIAFLATAAAAVNPVLLVNAGSITSETLFTTLTLASLRAAERADPARERRQAAAPRDAVWAGAFAVAAALTRSAGVTLVAALGVHWLYRRRYRWVLALGVAASVSVGAWLAWTVAAPSRQVRRSYVDDAVNVRVADGSEHVVQRVKRNVSTYQTSSHSSLRDPSVATRQHRLGRPPRSAAGGLVSAWGAGAVWYLGA
jgi:hypothetical protein